VADAELLADVAALPCIICGRQPVTVHHLREDVGLSQRALDDDAIPLCPEHHQDGGHGVAIHAGRRAWEGQHGSVWELLRKTHQLIEQRRALRIGSRAPKQVVRDYYGPRPLEERRKRRRKRKRKMA